MTCCTCTIAFMIDITEFFIRIIIYRWKIGWTMFGTTLIRLNFIRKWNYQYNYTYSTSNISLSIYIYVPVCIHLLINNFVFICTNKSTNNWCLIRRKEWIFQTIADCAIWQVMIVSELTYFLFFFSLSLFSSSSPPTFSLSDNIPSVKSPLFKSPSTNTDHLSLCVCVCVSLSCSLLLFLSSLKERIKYPKWKQR
mgnify:CR=1 FL=1